MEANTLRPLWPPAPFRAGFCITDDTDAATLERVRAVYDLLDALGIRASKTVWAFAPAEPCGIPALPDSIRRGITLEDTAYTDYCARLAERGFEICLHGASSGNNRRERTAAALELIERRFGPAGTFICHAKNAENPYWHEKVAPRGPVQWALGLASRYRCSGEDPASPYFWGDLCLDKVRHIRLFRTRDTNTLARSPGMPYFDPGKPYVPGWFAATKRSFHDCTSEAALRDLVEAGGLCVLYQYMHRYADAGGRAVDPVFRADAERLAAADAIWKETTSRIMERLRLIQGVFLARRGGIVLVMNANDAPVTALQIAGNAGPYGETPRARRAGGVVVVDRIEPGAFVPLLVPRGVPISARHEVRVDAGGRGRRDFGAGTIDVDLGPGATGSNAPALRVTFRPGFEKLRPFSIADTFECYRRLAEQLSIIGREVLFKGRSLDSRRFLGADTITLEDHSKW